LSSFIELLKPLHVDHVAVTTARFEDTVRDYLAVPGARIQRGPGFNDQQRVRFAFVRLDGGLVIEVLGLPESGESPIESHVAKGGGAYHVCYAVADIEASLANTVKAGARVVVAPKPDPAHDGRPVAFVIHPAHGLVELVAAYPVELTLPAPVIAGHHGGHAGPPAGQLRPSETIDRELIGAFKSVLKKLSESEIRSGQLGSTKGWDSLAQIQLTMEIERRLGIRIPMRQVEKLTSFDAFATFAVAHAN
jgi:acyl carrier protein/catechol 2,3-dioxygenase-like lactoylglutathione lyase family enzyme